MDYPMGASGTASRGKLAILIDGACDMCRTGAEAIRHYDESCKIEIFDLQRAGDRERFPQFKLDDLLEELHAVDDRGNVFRGARAINEVLRRQGGITGLLAYLWYLPGYAWLADWQYKRMAATRYERDAHCKLKARTASAAQS